MKIEMAPIFDIIQFLVSFVLSLLAEQLRRMLDYVWNIVTSVLLGTGYDATIIIPLLAIAIMMIGVAYGFYGGFR